MTQNTQDKIKEVCQKSIDALHVPLANAIAMALSEGYRLGFEDAIRQIQEKQNKA